MQTSLWLEELEASDEMDERRRTYSRASEAVNALTNATRNGLPTIAPRRVLNVTIGGAWVPECSPIRKCPDVHRQRAELRDQVAAADHFSTSLVDDQNQL